MFQNFFIVLSLVAAGCAVSPKNDKQSAQSLGGLSINLEVKKKVLKNGLRVLVLENPKLPIFSYYTYYDVGGRFETREEGTTGATHFLEHMMFKGTPKFRPGTFERVIEGNGGSNNAYTTMDSTVYYENVPNTVVEKIIELEADRMGNILLEPNSVESERKVVMEERKMRYENSPGGKLFLNMMQETFKGTPYGGSVIGDVKDLKSLTRDQLLSFHKEHYVPNNAIIVVVGDVDADDVISEIEDQYGDLKPNEALAEFKKTKETRELYSHKTKWGRRIKLNGNSENVKFMVAYPGEPLGTRKAFVMDILSSILGDGTSSYLNQKFVTGKRPVLSDIGVGNYNLKHNGVFFVSGELLKGKSLKGFERSYKKVARKMCARAINERNLQKTKNQYLISYYKDLQTNSGIAEFLGIRENFYGDYGFYKKEIEIYDSISLEEVMDVCRETFGNEKKPLFLSIWKKHPKRRS